MKTRKLFGLVLVLSMMFLFVQYKFRRPAVSRISSIINQAQKQAQALMAQRRDPYQVYCDPPPLTEEIIGSFSRNNSLNDTVKTSRNLYRNRIVDKEDEIQNIAVITGHRAGGSTVQNILLHFALTRNLNVLLPKDNKRSVNENDTFAQINMTEIVPIPPGQTYNIMYYQTIFNKDILSNFFPKFVTYIGILRHPLNQSASAFYFHTQHQQAGRDATNLRYSLASKASEHDSFRLFISKPSTYEVDAPNYSFTNNRQSIDLGFPVTSSFEDDKNDTSKIATFIKDVDKKFGLIMITELFDESLILFRRLLHWKMEDILYTKLSDSKDHTSDIELLSETDLDEHRKWATIDYALYGHFRSKLEGMILAQGEGFQQELHKFREVQKKVDKFCTMIKTSFRSLELRIKPTEWSAGLCITPSFCDMVSKHRNSMAKLVKKHQLENIKILSGLSGR